MWRSTMLLLCLLAALSGTPLRQAEAADDFARSMSELGQGHIIETIDGGVGDDVELSILKAGGETHSPPAWFFTPTADNHFASFAPALSRPIISHSRWNDPPVSLLISTAGRFAWLQCFLF